ncbi:MAG: filamentation induced by cAMP protein fic [Tenericutes bacterium GWC2_34_14]|nr:MAG: filamentation induced by cAMP protein fic [Tenericutes bacterium GWA2_35_7]OHE29364.1 MAG: filamentation induced by cAMP protein fic [Tenericutes bacterium GWC2_34_14]OHE34461.1 MAG: filamentation induced by cAMP protein fic [Tenericutes bacterium GWE2_34_108]OHE35817.1 MAG: filamentation induced by cAMP protein fic [Tenericutes bacterium GWF1_35_14]OHE39096.1 MAG: filamentation induced by cAMP protein fic [Tenericutes bacterium GWF2_35_184]OHE42837.1 MAG: filamentation induced by cAMP
MSRSGIFVRQLFGDLSYQTFKPSNLPPQPHIVIDDRLDSKMKEAYFLLGKLDGISKLIPNKDLFISMYVRKEALLSSQIEGTQATLDDIFDPHISKHMNLDIEEVLQYLKALHHGDLLLKEIPLSNRFIKQVHHVLLSSTRGHDKEPGEFRRTQNWIAAQGKSLKDAAFIPPSVSDMKEALNQLETYMHHESFMDPLLKISLIHYQFETIHPFFDGNGRMGRLLISFLLKSYGLLEDYTLYMSYYLKKNRNEYYQRLMEVRLNGHYEQWVMFFIDGVIESTKHALNTIDKILDLRDSHLKLLFTLKGKVKQTALLLFDYLQAHPIIDIKQASLSLNKSFNAISSAVETLINMGLLKKVEGHLRYRIFSYEPYLEILRDGTE